MNKKQLKKDLEELYYGGFVKGYWDLEYVKGHAYTNEIGDGDFDFLEAINELETVLFDKSLFPDEVVKVIPFVNALKRWDKLKNSPLMKALT